MNLIKNTVFIDLIYRIVLSHIVPDTQLPLLEANVITEDTLQCVFLFLLLIT